MNQILDELGGGDGGPIAQLAAQFGLSPQQAESAVRGLAPALTGALRQNASQPGGMDALQRAVSTGNHSRYVENPSTLAEPATTEDGNAILGHLLGSKDASRQLAGETAASTGLPVDLLKQMLPLVATLVMGQVGRKSGGGSAGGLGSLLEGLGGLGGLGGLTGATSGAPAGGASSGGLGGLLGKLFRR